METHPQHHSIGKKLAFAMVAGFFFPILTAAWVAQHIADIAADVPSCS